MNRLVGDGIENPVNVEALADAAAMFGVACLLRGARAGQDSGIYEISDMSRRGAPDISDLRPIVAVENAPGAESVYQIRKVHSGASIVVGNERRGIRPDLLRAAAHTVCIPMPGRGVNTLNVATAAAVAMYYLLGARGRRSGRGAGRPGVLLAAPRDHVEAGSSLRSAAAFGWGSVAVQDREKVWFGTPRSVRAEGRAAARSHRNPLRVVPVDGPDPVYSRIVVCSPGADGPPVHRADLTGAGTLLVIADDGWEAPRGAERVRVDVPGTVGRYRFLSGIVLAEAARQLGTRGGGAVRRGLSYGSGFEVAAPQGGELVEIGELMAY
ncbi:TrmH family RNA methyltransferase [Dactylosporangium sp. CA-233914]|uniref:TrmH family RNA methyltransferase n=1 Tax=Dactylosporangium sp. CA-233914 TaxID=3239934 RepID=UPI003D8A3F6E